MQNKFSNLYPTTLTVAVIGPGEIGLPLAVQYAEHGRRVIGCDISSKIIEMVNAGLSHVEEPGLAPRVARLVEKRQLSATTQTAEAVRQEEVVVVSVPMAVDAQHEVNFEEIDAATRAIGASLQQGTMVIY